MKIALLGGIGPHHGLDPVEAVWRAFRRAGHEPYRCSLEPDITDGTDLLITFKVGWEKLVPGHIRDLPVKAKLFWSFDDPHWLKTECLPLVAKMHHAALTSCMGSVGTYAEHGIKAHFLPLAMDLDRYSGSGSIHIPCSFACTNLYPKVEYPYGLIDRKEMVTRLTKELGNGFSLYGKGRAVEANAAWRCGFNREDDVLEVIERTSMNINNHLHNEELLYFNNRFFQIAGARRAQFVDRVNGFTDLFGEYDTNFIWYGGLGELTEKIRYYKDKPDLLRKIGQTGFERMRGWTYDALAKNILAVAEGKAPLPTFME